jgi:hypothetical protein
MKLLCFPVIVLAMTYLVVFPVCADESHGAVSGENTSESFFITIDPTGDHYSGDTILLQGSTNLPATDKLLVKIYSSSYHPGIHGVEYGISENVTILPGENGTTNRWSIEVMTDNWRQDEYLATVYPDTDIYTHDRGYAGGLFNLFAADKRPAENLTPVKTALPSISVQATTQVTPILTTTQPAPLSIINTLAAIGGLLMVAGMRKRQ